MTQIFTFIVYVHRYMKVVKIGGLKTLTNYSLGVCPVNIITSTVESL